MRQNLLESARQLKQEGDAYQLAYGHDSWRGDNFTVAIMLNEASHGSTDPLRYAMLNIKATDGESATLRFANGIDVPDDQITSTYAQYWHGYLTILKPLLLFLNLEQIRSLNSIVFAALVTCAAIVLSKRGGGLAGLAFVLSFVAMKCMVPMMALSLSATMYVAVLGSLFVLWRTRDNNNLLLDKGADWGVFFLVTGGMTAFFDFLCTPILTLGVPLAVLVFASRHTVEKGILRKALFGLVVQCACWAIGYAFVFGSKWVLASCLTGVDVMGNGLAKLAERSGTHATESLESSSISRLDAVVKNVRLAFPKWLLVLLLVCAMVLVFVFVFRRARGASSSSTWWLVPMFVTAALPYVWYVCAANHSYQHTWFTYRGQVVTLLCLGLVLAGLVQGDARSLPASAGKHVAREQHDV